METFRPQQFQARKAEQDLQERIKKEQEKRKRKAESGSDILASSEAEETNEGRPQEFDISEETVRELERQMEDERKRKKPDGLSVSDTERQESDGKIDELIKEGESVREELLKDKRRYQEKQDEDSDEYKGILQNLRNIESELERIRSRGDEDFSKEQERQPEGHKIEVTEEIEQVNDEAAELELADKTENYNKEESEDQTRSKQEFENISDDESAELELADKTGEYGKEEPMEKISPSETMQETSAQEATAEKAPSSEKGQETSARETNENAEPSKEQLRANVEQLHGVYVDMQRKFTQAKNKIGILGRIRQKLGVASEEKKDELNQLKREFNRAKVELAEAEYFFGKGHKEYTSFVTKRKKEELINEQKNILKKDGWNEQKINEYIGEKYKKSEAFQDAIKTFIIAEKTVAIKREKDLEGGGIEVVTERVSLLEDMNEKLKAVNNAKMEVLNEKDKNILQKSWDWYRKLSKKQRIVLGVAFVAPLSAGAALVGGATTSVALGVASLAGGRRVVSSLAGVAAGGYAFKKTKEYLAGKQEETEKTRENRMAKEYAGKEKIDLYKFMKDRLAQEKNDNYKSLAAAGAAGFAAGAGMRGLFAIADIGDITGHDVEKPEIENLDVPKVGIDNASLGEEVERILEANKGLKKEMIEGAIAKAQENNGIVRIFRGEGGKLFIETFKSEQDMDRSHPISPERVVKTFDFSEKDSVAEKTANESLGEDAEVEAKAIKVENEPEPSKPEELELSVDKESKIPTEPDDTSVKTEQPDNLKNEQKDEAIDTETPKQRTPEEIVTDIEEAARRQGKMLSLKEMREYKQAKIALANEKLISEEDQASSVEENNAEKSVQAPEQPPEQPQVDIPEENVRSKAGEWIEPPKEMSEIPREDIEDKQYSEVGETGEENMAEVGEEENENQEPEVNNEQSAEETQEQPIDNKENSEENIAEAMNFETKLKQGDTVWEVLEDKMDGDQSQVAEAVNEFRKTTAESVAKQYGLSQKDSLNYIHWRFRHLHADDLVSMKNGHLDVEGFADEKYLDQFAERYGVHIDKSAELGIENATEENVSPEVGEQIEPSEETPETSEILEENISKAEYPEVKIVRALELDPAEYKTISGMNIEKFLDKVENDPEFSGNKDYAKLSSFIKEQMNDIPEAERRTVDGFLKKQEEMFEVKKM